MIEYVLVVWLFVGGVSTPGFEIGVYADEARCEAARDSVQTEESAVSFVATCRLVLE